MTTIHLTDVQRDQLAVGGVFATDGERCPTCDGEGLTMGYGRTHPCERCNGTGFVAPEVWRKLTEPCATCDQTAERLHDAYEAAAADEGWATQERSRKPWSDVPEANKRTMRRAIHAVFGCPNPDCDRGRQVVTLAADCYHADRDRIGRLGHLKCTRCNAESNPGTGYRWLPFPGVVTLGRFTIDGAYCTYLNKLQPWPQPGQFVLAFTEVPA